ncbi:MAG: ribose-5-phosphate isomerase RpiA [Hyphomicrobiales bacterium]
MVKVRPEGSDEKRAAARAALDCVDDGMRLGLGTGTTAQEFVKALGEKVAKGLKVLAVPTSEATRKQAEALGIPLSTLDETPALDLTVDGADEIDGRLDLIKGGGGALLREKIVATSSKRMIVIADGSKMVETLGRFPLPVEVVPFGWKATARKIEKACRWADCRGAMVLRAQNGKPFVTDNGNIILDCALGRIGDPPKLAAALSSIPGVVEHGLFIGIASLALIGTSAGVKRIER